MKGAFLLLAGLMAASAVRVTPSTDSEVTVLTKKVEGVVAGLDKVYAKQSSSAGGPTRFAGLLKPFLAGLNSVLKEVKEGKLTDAQKVEKLQNAQASVKGLTQDMKNLSKDLSSEGQESTESLLMGVLMARKNRPEAEQMEVLQSAEFKNLEVVKYVLAHTDSKKSLVEQVAAFLDQKSKPKVDVAANVTKAAPVQMSLQDVTAGIVSQLTVQLKKMEAHVAVQEALNKKVDAEMADGLKKDEVKISSLKGADKQKKNRAERALKAVRSMSKKQDRQFAKKHAAELHDISTLKSAIEDVKKGDMKALASAQKAMAHSLASMQGSTQDFLHFLQMNEYTDSSRDGACPYCKAQCLEKCHANGTSFMSCMTTCADVGN